MADGAHHTGLPARKGTREALVWGGLAFIVFSILTLPSVLIAGGAYLKAPRLRRMESGVIALGAMVVFALDPGGVLAGQPKWLAICATLLHGSPWSVPWLSIGVTAAWYYGIAGFFSTTKVGGKVHGRIKTAIRTTRDPLWTDTLIPKDATRAQVRVAPIPGGIVTVSAQAHAAEFGHDSTDQSISIGLDKEQRPFLISEEELSMHAMVLGSTGSGKTVTLQSLMAALLDLGHEGWILDMKEDIAKGGLRDFCDEYATTHGIPYQHLALSDPISEYWLNPLDGMNADYARDTILALTPFDDHYWQNINKKMLGQLINLEYDAHECNPIEVPFPTIYDIGRVLEQGDLNRSTKKLRAIVVGALGEAADLTRYSALAAPEPDGQKSASGFGAKLTQIYDTIAGRTVLRPGDGRKQLDIAAPGLVYIGLDSTGKPDLSALVASAVLQRISVYVAQRTTGHTSKGKSRFLIIDEASVINRSILKALLSKARSAGVSVIVCTQGPDDWIDKDGDDWSELTQNVNVAIIMAQGSAESAEICAKYLGETTKLQKSLSLEQGEFTERSSARENVDYLVQPHELRRLSKGETVIRVGKPRERVAWVSVQRRVAGARSERRGRLRD